jgi:hypothetical protein
MQDQASLGGKTANRQPGFNDKRFAKVTDTKDFHKYGKISAVFLDYSQPSAIWVVGDIDREPVSGDMIVVGYLDGRKDSPYLAGFVKNQSYTTNFLVVKKDKIKLQLPVYEIGVKDGVSHEDVKTHLLDNSKQDERAYIELAADHALISFPTSQTGATAPAIITVTASGVTIDHPAGTIKHHTGSKGAARAGDTVSVSVPGIGTCTGTITSASTKTLID